VSQANYEIRVTSDPLSGTYTVVSSRGKSSGLTMDEVLALLAGLDLERFNNDGERVNEDSRC